LVGALAQLLQGNGFLFVSPLDAYYWATFVWSCSIFMLVLGIIMPLYLGLNMSLGVTRREHTSALLIVGTTLCLLFAVFGALLQTVFGNYYLPTILHGFVIVLCAYLAGWVIVLGFQFRRVTTAIGGFIAVAAISGLVGFVIAQFAPGSDFLTLEVGTYISSWIELAGYAALCILFIAR
jgi:hypothetical protein